MSRTAPGSVRPDLTPSYPPEGGAPATRMLALDGVRGLAIIAVLVYHFVSFAATDAGRGPAFDRVLTKITGAGWTGVDLFFVLSGFLITGILIDAKSAGATSFFRNFYVRRSLRIFPAHYVYLALLFLLIPLLAPGAHAATNALAHDRLWFIFYLGNILAAIHGATRPDFFVTGHLWSLAVEEQYYLIWPAVVLLFPRRRLAAICLLMIAGALATRIILHAAGAEPAASLTLAPARMDALAMGGLIALAVRQPALLTALRRWLPGLAAFSAAAVAAIALRDGRLAALDTPTSTLAYTLIAVVFGWLVLASLSLPAAGAAARVLTSLPLRSTGKYSYAMYLVHLPVGWLLFQRTNIAADVPALFGSHLPGYLAFTAAAAIPTFLLAWLSWRLIETPFLRLKSLFPYASAGSSPTPAATRAAPLASEGPAA